ncbi:hypothetical protein A3D78_06745 [Candidatus Gottesmanbacteria bacterium RIFCSPHIGHO2_02_FULL_39_14]|uniref:Uncharacterized protein n=1 Tax=Candidatus Gottesmanbacteria bacterium RIFCSPHIGHO2_02_FULL_39_14 TaxID=1798383 RepID=A0A1F6A452_9BACT|nr:MAG: hypothetical protein A3D78_06745 [Candidatus Gottesmanbacteria bacterium RIFCSPHIGHO2_02_FULL_39_14]
MKKKQIKESITDNEIRQLVVERLRGISSNKKVSIGSMGEFSKEEMIHNVQENSEIGKKIIEIQLEYIRALKEGLFFNEGQDANNPPQS